MNNKILKIIIFIVILIILIVAGILIFNKFIDKEEDMIDEDLTISLNENLYILKDKQTFFSLETLLQKYINSIYEKDTEKIIGVLDKDYINANKITNDNVLDKIINISNEDIYNAELIYVKEKEKGNIYYIYGNIKNKAIYNKIVCDDSNSSYSIKPITKQEYENAENGKIEDTKIDVKLNKYNVQSYIPVKDEIVIGKYFTKYRELCKNDVDKAYSLLDKSYREKRFGNINEFKKYINDIKNELEQIYATGYQKNVTTDYIEYICTDKNGNIYIFNETSPMQYTLILDTYTIEQEKFTKEYAQANVQKKVMMNIDKFIQMINAKDYSSAYKCLAQSFKNNYFPTQNSFENYVKQKLYRYNTIDYEIFDDSVSGVYQYSITIKNKQNEKERINFDIIMKLNEDTNFEMSFNK